MIERTGNWTAVTEWIEDDLDIIILDFDVGVDDIRDRDWYTAVATATTSKTPNQISSIPTYNLTVKSNTFERIVKSNYSITFVTDVLLITPVTACFTVRFPKKNLPYGFFVFFGSR